MLPIRRGLCWLAFPVALSTAALVFAGSNFRQNAPRTKQSPSDNATVYFPKGTGGWTPTGMLRSQQQSLLYISPARQPSVSTHNVPQPGRRLINSSKRLTRPISGPCQRPSRRTPIPIAESLNWTPPEWSSRGRAEARTMLYFVRDRSPAHSPTWSVSSQKSLAGGLETGCENSGEFGDRECGDRNV